MGAPRISTLTDTSLPYTRLFLAPDLYRHAALRRGREGGDRRHAPAALRERQRSALRRLSRGPCRLAGGEECCLVAGRAGIGFRRAQPFFSYRTYHSRSEEHTSELQSLIRNSFAVFCFKKKKWHGPGNQADPKHPTALRMLPTDAADRHRPLAMHDYSPNLNNQTITNSNNTAHR